MPRFYSSVTSKLSFTMQFFCVHESVARVGFLFQVEMDLSTMVFVLLGWILFVLEIWFQFSLDRKDIIDSFRSKTIILKFQIFRDL